MAYRNLSATLSGSVRYIPGPAGEDGADGGYYTPSVSDTGELTWAASKEDMPKVAAVNIKGEDGKSAYSYAAEAGYSESEEQFAIDLAKVSKNVFRMDNMELRLNTSVDLTEYGASGNASRMSAPVLRAERGEHERIRIDSVGCYVTGAGTVRFALYEWDGLFEGGSLVFDEYIGEVTATGAGVVKLDFEAGYYTTCDRFYIVALSSSAIISCVENYGIYASSDVYFEDAAYTGGTISTTENTTAFWLYSHDYSLCDTATIEEAANDSWQRHYDADKRFTEIEKDIADLQYVPIAITKFAHNKSVQELGAVVESIGLSYAFNKTATKIELDGEDITADYFAKQLTGLSLTETKTWTLKATDERGATASKTATLYFYNGVYYGVGTESVGVSELTKELSNTRKRSFTVTAGEGEYVWYALPARLGECTFTVGGFKGGFMLYATMDYENTEGYTESYYIYRSDNANLGTITVEVS